MKKILFLLFALFLLAVKPVFAADLNIDCPASPTTCSKTGVDPLFSIATDGYWYPGKSITKTLNLKNSGPETREMAIRGTRTSTVNILENVMHISIVGGTTVIWAGSITDFYNQEKIVMGTFAPGANLDYNFTVFMSSGAGDEYQNKETVFDLTLGFWGEPIPTPTPMTTPVPTPTSAPGAVLGAGVSAPVCSDTKPAGAPILLSATAGVNSVKLVWLEGTGPLSYYLVAFGLTSGSITYGNPNIGSAGTTSYTVSNLSGGTTYYFRVRAGNGCMPGDYSNELPATPTGIFIAGPAVGFVEGVLGAQEGLEGELGGGISSQEGTLVEGVKIEKVCPFWWIVLIGQTVVLGIFYALNLRRKEWLKRWWIVTIAAVLLAYLIDHYAHTHWYVPSRWCPWEKWLGIILASVETIIFRHFKKTS